MRVLITGALGYVGLAVSRRLAKTHDVVLFGHRARKDVSQLIPARAEVHVADLMEVASVRMGDVDAIVHLAGGGGAGKCEADPCAAVRSNIRGTSALVAFARQQRARLLFASTIAVYGTFRESTEPYVEDDEPQADDLYGTLKLAAEDICKTLGDGAALRMANVYGAGGGIDLGIQGAVERFARAAAKGDTLTILGSGQQRIDYVHIDDVADAFELALIAPKLPAAVNIGGGQPIAIKDLAQLCVDAGRELGAQPTIVSKPMAEGKVWPDRSLSIGLAKRILDWQPRTRMVEGIRELVAMMHSEK